MNQNENVVVKTSKGVIALLVILVIAVIGLSVYAATINKDKCDVKGTKEEVTVTEKESEKKEETKVDNSAYLKTATEVYTNAYNMINGVEEYVYNETELSKYFTKKAIQKIYTSSVNDGTNLSAGIFFSGVFGKVDQGIRNITFVSATDDTIIVNAQLTNNPNGDNDPYPMYIVLKKDSNTYKIDLFE